VISQTGTEQTGRVIKQPLNKSVKYFSFLKYLILNICLTAKSLLQVCFIYPSVLFNVSLISLLCVCVCVCVNSLVLVCLCATWRLLFVLMCVLRVCGSVGTETACRERMPMWTCSHYPLLAWQ